MKRYKFLYLRNNEIISKPDVKTIFKWKKGKWYKINGKLRICHNGFHCSVKPLNALNYVSGGVLAVVEVRGGNEKQSGKECWEEMQITKAYRWTKKDSVALAVYSAELVIGNFEKEYPDDNRPRKAIEAAKKVLKNDTPKNREAAEAAAKAAAPSKINKWMIDRVKKLDEIN